MARYNTFLYGDVQVTFGGVSGPIYSVTPFTAEPLDYDKIGVAFSIPGRNTNNYYTRLRVVRNQDYPSETQEDGVILYDKLYSSSLDPLSGNVQFVDGTLSDANKVPFPALRQGRYVYYSIWLLKTTGGSTFWDKIADASTLLAKSHDTVLSNTDSAFSQISNPKTTRTRTTHQKLMELLPKVYTTSTENPLDAVDENSDLSRFLKAFSYTLDEIFTYADLLLPTRDATNYSPDLIRAKSYELGLYPDNQPSTRTQQKLVREAQYMYSRKGTKLALGTFAESITGYNATVSISPNLMLSPQDSTFYRGVGSWTTFGACTLTADKIGPAPVKATIGSDIDRAIDVTYCGKVVTTATNAQINNGSSSPITRGIPVEENKAYSLSAYLKNSTGTVTPTIRWFTATGAAVTAQPTSTSSAWTTASSWTKNTYINVVSPATAAYATIELKFSVAGTYYVDMIQFALGTDVVPFQEARGAEVYLSPTKTNYLSNPSFETNLSSWTITDSGASAVILSASSIVGSGTSATVTTSSAHGLTVGSQIVVASASITGYNGTYEVGGVTDSTHFTYLNKTTGTATGATITDLPSGVSSGSKCLQAIISSTKKIETSVASGSGDLAIPAPYIGVKSPPGFYYTYSFYAKTLSSTTSATVTLKAVSGATTITNSSTISIGTVWSRFQVNLFIPVSLSAPTLTATLLGNSTDATIRFDSAQLERAYSATDYFDGSLNVNGNGGVWSGTANASPSFMFPNQSTVLYRLSTEMPAFLVTGTPYVVTNAKGIASTPLGNIVGFAP